MNRRPVRASIVAGLLLGAAGPAGAGPAPVPFGINITAPFSAQPPSPLVLQSLQVAGRATSSVSFTIQWQSFDGSRVSECVDFAPYITQAKQAGMVVVLRFELFGGDVILIPDRYDPRSLTNPEVRQGFLDEVTCYAAAGADYLVLANEVNILEVVYPEEFAEFFPGLYGEGYAAAKAISPGIDVGVSYQLLGLRFLAAWDIVDRVGPQQDFIALSSLFGTTNQIQQQFPTVDAVPPDFYQVVRDALGPDARVVFTEFGWATFRPGSVATQRRWVQTMAGHLDVVRPELVLWTTLHDGIELFDVVSDIGQLVSHDFLGLRRLNGRAKPAWQAVLDNMESGVFVPFPASNPAP